MMILTACAIITWPTATLSTADCLSLPCRRQYTPNIIRLGNL